MRSPLSHLQLPLIYHHPDLARRERSLEIRACGICGRHCLANRRAARWLAVNPLVLIMCCQCSHSSEVLIQTLVPGHEYIREDLPDLARLGIFN